MQLQRPAHGKRGQINGKENSTVRTRRTEGGKCTARYAKFYREANARHSTQNTGGDIEAGHLQVTAPLTNTAGTQGVSSTSLAVTILRPVRNGAGKLGLDLIVLKNDIGGNWQTFQVAA